MGATLQDLKKMKELEQLMAKQAQLRNNNNSEAVDLLKKMLAQVQTSPNIQTL